MTFKNFISITLIILLNFNAIAQDEEALALTSNENDIVMTWNKSTPDSEMKDDIKALAEKGITIKYSNLKRNSKNEITAIKVEFSDRKGNKGNLSYDNQKPIGTIKFYSQNGEIGFGEPSNSYNPLVNNDFFNNLNNPQDIIKQFQFNNNGNDSQSFSYDFGNGESLGKSSSKMIIKKEGKKALVIQDGQVIEGGDDYTKEELENIKKTNRLKFNDGNEFNKNEFDFRIKQH